MNEGARDVREALVAAAYRKSGRDGAFVERFTLAAWREGDSVIFKAALSMGITDFVNLSRLVVRLAVKELKVKRDCVLAAMDNTPIPEGVREVVHVG